jgi:hypothetical protein
MARLHHHLLACLLPLIWSAPQAHAQSAPQAHAQSAQKPQAVVELFTSQGCSSCPPADALMMELSRDPAVIALTLPVTYWDYLGWKDTLGQDAFSKRQKLYAKARGDNQIYTPQAVINGTSHMIGSEKSEIRKRIADLAADPLDAGMTLSEDGGTLRITLAPLPGAAETPGSVWVLPTSREVTVPITRGENQGKTVTYANVVRALVRVGSWDGRAAEMSVPIASTQAPDADGYVVIVQAEKPGRMGYPYPGEILAAARGGR